MSQLKRLATIVVGQSPASDDVLPLSDGTPFLQGNAEFGHRFPEARYQCDVATKHCVPSDVLISVRAPVGAVNIADQRYAIGRGLCAVRPRAMDADYLYWFLLASQTELDSLATGSTFGAVSSQTVGALAVPELSSRKQRAIADYLDRETAQIDTLIAEQQRLIELLHERRVAAVVAGVVGNDEGTSERYGTWFGALPEAWQAGQIRHLGVVTIGKMLQPADSGADHIAPYLRAANVQPNGMLNKDDLKTMWFHPGELCVLDLRRGDVVVVEGGAGAGRAAYLDEEMQGVGFQKSINRVRPHAGNEGRYIAYAMNAARAKGFVDVFCNTASIPHLTAEKLARVPVPIPPPAEQRRIVAELDKVTAKIDTLIAEAERFIELAKERRSALITAAVTGQINIPGVA